MPLELPRHPRLLPGVLVTRRTDDYLQIGLDPGLAVITPDLPETREILARLRDGDAPVLGPGTPLVVLRLCAELVARNLLIDGDALATDLPASLEAAQAVAAVYAQAGRTAPETLVRRRTRPVRLDVPEPLAGLAHRLLPASGVPAGPVSPGPVSPVSASSGPVSRGPVSSGPASEHPAPYAALVVALGEVDRAGVDGLARDGTPYLVVRFGERSVEVGPFVVPGVTACLRCVDAHRGDCDPRRGLVVEQYAEAPAYRSDGVPHPVDPSVAAMVLGWAVRDLVSFVDDEQPSTWSATVRVGPGTHQHRMPWRRHPHCGCAWGTAAAG
jgi:hypothetical protein